MGTATSIPIPLLIGREGGYLEEFGLSIFQVELLT